MVTFSYICRIVAVFLLLWCCDNAIGVIELSDTYGSFQSPGYPDPYPDNQNLTWIIRANHGYRVVVYFTVFDLEDSYDEALGGICAYDYVKVWITLAIVSPKQKT